MNEFDTQTLVVQSERWPWKWFRIFRQAAALCEKERCKFNVLREEHHLLRMEAAELHRLRTSDAEKYQTLWSEMQTLKMDLASLQKGQVETSIREKSLSMEVVTLREERKGLIERHDQMKEGVATLFEFIRRNKVNDDRGAEIPNLRGTFPNIFRQ